MAAPREPWAETPVEPAFGPTEQPGGGRWWRKAAPAGTRISSPLTRPSPDTHSIGTGRAVVFRDDQRYDGKWQRATRGRGTSFVSASGAEIPLRPGGQTWVLLVPTTGKITG